MSKIPLFSKILEVLAGELSSIVCDEYVRCTVYRKVSFQFVYDG